ncbi:glycosyltransferase family 9 protein [Achromobacter aloeverae]|uniref:LPS biosynthesis glycosyltransferase n=1 Tax=Achromobacter aloeverae TaxID=1750518 RepID=A0A4Q1HGG0_9BURK|nr:glycosyltransferase family 9 protein [Achromobacter aloeverae]RXN86170.1 LPS biosynthesis glycosyltransferase [Achromobacter aloeverae]
MSTVIDTATPADPIAGASASPHAIAVFRALQLGDLLCSVPALRALRQAYPDAHVTLVGLPNAAPFVERFGDYVDELMVFPGIAAFPEQAAREDELPAFYARARARHFDLAIQLHGSGRQSNAIVEGLGSTRWAGFVPDACQARAGCRMLWPDGLPEPLRYTALMHHLGVRVDSHDLEFPLTAADRIAGQALARQAGLRPAQTILMHPGARLPSRRWPVERYAAVGRALQAQGWRVAITGSSDEAALAATLRAALGSDAVDLSGRTQLGALAALMRDCALLVCNDTGVSHIAAGVGAPSVVIACGSDAARWAPLDRTRHKVLFHDLPCRPCAHRVCPIGHPCATAVGVEDVLAAVQAKLGICDAPKPQPVTWSTS